jgi:hypothetical protein
VDGVAFIESSRMGDEHAGILHVSAHPSTNGGAPDPR